MTQPNQSTLSRKWVLEINTGTVAVPIWTIVKGLAEYTFTPGDPNLEDDNVYEDLGFTGQTKTALSVKGEGKVMRRTLPTDVTTYDPGQEKLRVLSNLLGPTGVGYFRTYYLDGCPESYTGAPTLITNPNSVTLALPTVTGLSPTTGTTAGGFLVIITGDNFTDRNGVVAVSGAASVKFAAANATSYTVLNRQQIAAIAPANTAGAKVVTVINTTGTSVVTQSLTYV
jgi:hypothetical protein